MMAKFGKGKAKGKGKKGDDKASGADATQVADEDFTSEEGLGGILKFLHAV